MSAYGTCVRGCSLSPYHRGDCIVTTSSTAAADIADEVRRRKDPNAPYLTRHDKCANLSCPNQAREGQMVTFVVPKQGHMKRDVIIILCSPCGEYLIKKYGG